MRHTLPKIIRKEICNQCAGVAELFKHEKKSRFFEHSYTPRLETREEAAYRQGYEAGYTKATDRAVWGPGWD